MMSSKAERTRTAILDAARRVFEERGTSEVDLADVARAAGVSRQAIYLHFGSRSGLVLALARHVDEVERLAEAAAEVHQAPTGVEELEAFVRLQARYTPRIAAIARLVDEGRRRDPALAAAWDDRMARRHAACTRIVERLRREGRLAPGWTVADAATLLWELTSIRSWEDLVLDRGWSANRYASVIGRAARTLLVEEGTC